MSVLTVILLRAAHDICRECEGVYVEIVIFDWKNAVLWLNIVKNWYKIFGFDWYGFV